MRELNDILGYKNLKIYQDTDYFKFSLDSVILANYANIRLKDKKICDLGTGNGVVPLILSKRTKNDLYCVEIQKKLYDLAIDSFKYNNIIDRVTSFNCDIGDTSVFKFNEYFDLVLCNPPYFKISDKSYLNLSIEKKYARHEVTMDLDKLFSVSFRILKNGGNLVIVHRPDRFMEILDNMRKYKLEPKRIKFIYNNVNSESKLMLIECQKNGKEGLIIDKPLILYNLDNTMSDEYSSLINEVRE